MMNSASRQISRARGDEYGCARVRIENIGGIFSTDVTLDPGVTVLTGQNATNRTSFLTALTDVLGGPSASLKSDAEEGHVALELNGTTSTREYSSEQGRLVTRGTQYTDQSDLVELFASVLKGNPVRRAVARGDDLRDLIMRPVDTDRIEREIREHKRERDRIEKRLSEIEREQDRLPDLEERKESLEAEIAETTAEIENLRETIDGYEADRETTEQANELLDELENLRQSLRDTKRKIDDRESEIERLEADLREAETALAEVSVQTDEIERLDQELERLRRRKRDQEESIQDLERILSFNEDILSGDTSEIPSEGSDDAEEVMAALDPSSQEIECWTCGSEVSRNAIDERLDELRTLITDRRSEITEVEAEIADLEERKRELQAKRDRKQELQTKRDRIEEQLDYQSTELEDLRAQRTELQEQLDETEQRVEETKELRESDLVDAYQQLSELEYDRGQLETDRDRLEEQLDEIEEMADEREELAARREELTSELESLRSRIDDLETTAVEQFNTHMETLLDLLEYDNLARVWIERLPGNSLNSESEFELHIVRESDEGAVYEDVVDSLSESEREVIGLVVVLAGYLVHEVYEDVPFMLLDSLEAIDARRTAVLTEYFAEFVPFLVIALLREDADTLDNDYQVVPGSRL